jgi:hypothetical protein
MEGAPGAKGRNPQLPPRTRTWRTVSAHSILAARGYRPRMRSDDGGKA